jgi:phosphoribosylglycinamide formyltransferase-1
MKRLVVLASGNGSNLQTILDACEVGALPAQVTAVISDRQAAFALERARTQQVPAVCHPWQPYRQTGRTRQEYDTDLAELAANYQPDFVVLAGWMRLLTMPFLGRFPRRVINLHPALPGAFPGTHAIERSFEAIQRAEIEHTGVMVHFVPDEGVDDGPVIAQEVVPIWAGENLDQFEARVHAVEHRLLIDALRLVFQQN